MTAHSAPLRPLGANAAGSRPVARRRPWALLIVIVLTSFFGLTYSRISLDRSAFVLDTLEDRIAEEQARHFDLRVEVAELRDPERIASRAARSGMTFPSAQVQLTVAQPPGDDLDPEYRWAQLKTLLSAQP